MAKKSNHYISVVVPLYNDSDIIEDYIQEVNKIIQDNYIHYEIILVDNGSTDNTRIVINSLLKTYPCIKYTRLSRYFGTEIAISAGLDGAIGDFIIINRPDSDPVELIPVFVDKLINSNGIVFGLEQNKVADTFFYKLGRKFFYKTTSWFFNFDLPPANTTLFCGLSRQALNAILSIKDKTKYLRIFGAFIGFNMDLVPYCGINRRKLQREKGFWESVRNAVDIYVMNTSKPLRYASYLGLFASVINLLYIGYIFIINLIKNNVAEGWTTLSLQNSVMFFILFIILSVISEYMDRVLMETKERPSYYIAEEKTSSVMVLEEQRRNIISEML
ncbi:MAG: glycosyltransferase [Cytophagaceae bacterium]